MDDIGRLEDSLEEQLAKVREMDNNHLLAWHDAGLVFLEAGQPDRA